MNNTDAGYLAALPPTVQDALECLVRAAAGLSIDEKDQASALALDVANMILADDDESPVVLPFGLLAGVIQEIWARSITFPPPREVVE